MNRNAEWNVHTCDLTHQKPSLGNNLVFTAAAGAAAAAAAADDDDDDDDDDNVCLSVCLSVQTNNMWLRLKCDS